MFSRASVPGSGLSEEGRLLKKFQYCMDTAQCVQLRLSLQSCAFAKGHMVVLHFQSLEQCDVKF